MATLSLAWDAHLFWTPAGPLPGATGGIRATGYRVTKKRHRNPWVGASRRKGKTASPVNGCSGPKAAARPIGSAGAAPRDDVHRPLFPCELRLTLFQKGGDGLCVIAALMGKALVGPGGIEGLVQGFGAGFS